MNKKFTLPLNALIIFACLLSATKAENNLVEYPEGYRHWSHVKSMVIQEGHSLYESFGGIHHIYANDKAMIGYKSGKFPDGSVIIFDLLESTLEGNAIVEKQRKVLGVMEKDSIRFSDTAGWGFEGFVAGNAEKRAVGKEYKDACFACHTAQKENDYVFSRWRE
jgi:hypothetical protein